MNHTGNKNIEHKPKQYNDSKHHDSQGSCNICAIQLLYWAPQTYRTRRNTIVILGTTLAQHKHLCNTIVILGTTNIISHASCSIESLYRTSRAHSHHCIARVVLNTTSESARQQHVPLINNSNNNTID